MIATNHALTGALIGLSIGHPIALSLAFASHFVLDAIPHFSDDENLYIKSKLFSVQLVLDALFCGVLVLVLAFGGPANWLLAAGCAFLAASPDFMWIPKFLRARRGQKEPKKQGLVIRFHSWIQWFQKPVGAVVEIVWLVATLTLLVNIL